MTDQIETPTMIDELKRLAGVLHAEFRTWSKIKARLAAWAIIAALPKEANNG